MRGPDAGPTHAMLKESWGGAYVANGGFAGATGAAWVADGRADAISFGSAFIANPALPWRILQGLELNAPDRDTFYQGGPEGYVDYPAAGFR